MAPIAGHVNSLELNLALDNDMSAAALAEAQALLAGIVSMCGTGGGLRRLRLFTLFGMHYSSWLASLSSVQELKLRGLAPEEEDEGASQLTVSLHGLTRCERLHLGGLVFEPPQGLVPALPSSLTSLELHELGYYLPSQVGLACQWPPP